MKHTLEKYYLLGILPVIYKEEYDNEVFWKLFKFIPLVSVEKEPDIFRLKLFGIPLIKKTTKTFCSNWTYRILRTLACLPTKRNVVLIMDCIYEPNANIEDNFTLFKYLYNSKDKKLEPYYAINTDSPYYNKLKEEYKDRIIGFGKRPTSGLKLKLFGLMPKIKYVCDSFQSIKELQLNLSSVVKKSPYVFSIFTQHGITYFKPVFVNNKRYGFAVFDYVTVSNDTEKEIFKTRGGFPESRILNNGLFRWDNVHDTSSKADEKSIFVFFTKRDYFKTLENVPNCEYVKQIRLMLTDNRLQEVLAKYNVKIKLGIHHSIADNVKNCFSNKNIELISEDEISNVKCESSLLLTDYSSMCFEFFLQNKPVIFYKINDSEDCMFYNSSTDVINPYDGKEQELFNIAANINQLIELLIKYIENNFECEEEILDKESKFFYYRNDFCSRFETFLLENMDKKKDKEAAKA